MIHLQKVDSRNTTQLLALQVHESQRGFVADNRRSMEEAAACTKAGGYACPFGIYDDDTPVGFLMVGYGVDDDWENPPAIAHNNYNLWRLMIDRKHQGNGYGKQALKLALDFIRTKPAGDAEYCWLSYEPENHVAKKLYASFGFRETGDMDENEIIAVLTL